MRFTCSMSRVVPSILTLVSLMVWNTSTAGHQVVLARVVTSGDEAAATLRPLPDPTTADDDPHPW